MYKLVKLIETETEIGIVVMWGWGEQDGELCNRYRVSVLQDDGW